MTNKLPLILGLLLTTACGEKEPEPSAEPSGEPATEPAGEPSDEIVDEDGDGVAKLMTVMTPMLISVQSQMMLTVMVLQPLMTVMTQMLTLDFQLTKSVMVLITTVMVNLMKV